MRRIEQGADEYPRGLLDLDDAPEGLWLRGAVDAGDPAVAIVGSRAATAYGIGIATALARDLARAGVVVVSGLAFGIDAAAHRGALEGAGRTIALLPGGLDHVVPSSHAALAEEITQRGALASEQPPGAPVFRPRYLERNRLIAAWSQVVVVVEAAARSGALSTAAAALRLGRPLLAVPGDTDRATSEGTNDLLRRGATVCMGAGDVLDALKGVAAAPRVEGAARGGAPAATATGILAALDAVPRTAEDLAARAGLPLERALADLLPLEWAGLVIRLPGPRFRRSERAR